MKIPFGYPIISKKEKKSVAKVLSNPILVHGPKSQQFEKNFASYTKSPYAISVSSCTAGMHLFYFSLGFKKGDEVIVSSQTHVATAHAIELTGAKAVFVDSEHSTGNIDISKIEKCINKKTKAITIVHYLGMPVDMIKIMRIAKKYNLYVLEDCALALGATIKNKHVGLFGDAGVFSFYPVKHITTAEGGMIITRNKKLAEKIKINKAFGVNKVFSKRKIQGMYDVLSLGLNYRMSEIHAAIGIEQLKKFKNFLKIRRNNFFFLNKFFKKLKTDIQVAYLDHKYLKSSFYCFTIILNDQLYKFRNEIILNLTKKKIGTSIYYPHPVPRLDHYKKKYGYLKKKFKYAEIFSDRSICLPVGPHLGIKELKHLANVFLITLYELKKKYNL
tara:strand:+ start:114 stop:1274 length:1161 start_codon:yes stop_codon:yes gene_type:complete